MSVIIRDVSVFDGLSVDMRRGMNVVVQDGLISQVNDGEVLTEPGDLVIDGRGRSVLPGLVDAHLHITLSGQPGRTILLEDVVQTAYQAVANARDTLLAGITTVRDVGGRGFVDVHLRDAIASGIVSGPRMLCAGHLIAMTGGHGDVIAREADGEDQVLKAVREQLRAGCDFVKVMASGGVMKDGEEPGSPELSEDEIRVAVGEAANHNKIVVAHAHGTRAIKNALRAGVRSIEHGTFLDDEAIEMMLEADVALCPTFVVYDQLRKSKPGSGITRFVADLADRILTAKVKPFERAVKAGIRVLAGTDCGSPAMPHGLVADEIGLLIGAGMKPAEAIRSATRLPCEVMGLDREIGAVKPGLRADLIMVEGDPLVQPELLKNPQLVMKDGELVKLTCDWVTTA